MAAGVYTVVAKKAGYLPSRLAVLVVDGEVVAPDLVLAPDSCRPGSTAPACADIAPGDADGDGVCGPDCSVVACGPNGTCSDETGVATCTCASGYAGVSCNTCVEGWQDEDGDLVCRPGCDTANLACGLHGSCAIVSGEASCACDAGYAGGACGSCAAGYQDDDLDGTCFDDCTRANPDCSGRGTCTTASGTAACACGQGYTGDDCSGCEAGYVADQGSCAEVLPVIDSFIAESTQVTSGGMAQLTGVFSGGEGTVTDLGPVQSGVPVQTGALDATRSYTLTVTSALGRVATETVLIHVHAPPVIESLVTNDAIVPSGGSTTLTAVFGGGNGSIDNGVGPVTSGVAAPTSALATPTLFTLTVTNPAGTDVIQQLFVDVEPPPAVLSFDATSTILTAGEGTTLLASFSGGTGRIEPAIGEVESGVAVPTGALSEDVEYVLTVTTPLGAETTARVSIDVVPPPAIDSFTAAAPIVTAGGSTTLTGVFSGGTG